MSEFDPVSFIMGAKSAGGGGGGSGGVTIVELEYTETERIAKMKAGAMYAAGQTSVLVLKDEYGSNYVVTRFFLDPDEGVYVFAGDYSEGLRLEAQSAEDYPTQPD